MNADGRPLVLLVDDDQDFLVQMSTRFAHEGWRVETAHNETEARAKLATVRPDLAVLDLMMDQLDGGFTLAHEIKQLDPRIPVLLVTGVTAETGLAFERAGAGSQSWIKADAVLAKPVRFEQIRRELDRLGVRHD
ncbi:MAG: response regulator [Krumholzibacteria bacterium]|nr:response regulator [Candidatus Krumholzibacteria bacterium]